MSDMEAVKAHYPDASWVESFGAIYEHGRVKAERISGSTWWNDEAAAWADARAVLEAKTAKLTPESTTKD